MALGFSLLSQYYLIRKKQFIHSFYDKGISLFYIQVDFVNLVYIKDSYPFPNNLSLVIHLNCKIFTSCTCSWKQYSFFKNYTAVSQKLNGGENDMVSHNIEEILNFRLEKCLNSVEGA